jgi:transcriptional regulator GlxA family with amidase domain
MRSPAKPVKVALLAVPDASAATLYGFYDALASVRRDWAMLHGGVPADSPIRPLVVSPDGQPFDAANGVRITPEASFSQCPRPDVVVVGDVMVPPGTDVGDRFDAAVQWLLACHASGALLASACSGAVLLARTGLLDGMDATSHWAYCDHLRRQHPRTRWHPERGLVVTGADERILMAGSGVSWHLLVLALVARFAGPEEAMHVARMNLMDLSTASPIAYASLTHGSQAADPAIARCQQWASSHYSSETPVAQMVALSQLPERSFKRRFSQATGMSPLEYVHHVRLEEAKQLLESGNTPIEAVAVDVGYSDSSFFGRLFRRKVGMTPAQYRLRFGKLARELQELAGETRRPARDRWLAARAQRALHHRRLHAVHLGEFLDAAAAGLERAAQRFALGGLLADLGEGRLQRGDRDRILGGHAFGISLARQARRFDRLHQARLQPRPQVFLGAGLAAAKNFHDRVMHMFGRHVFDRHAVQVVALFTRCHALQVARRARVQAERDFEVFLLELIRVQRHDFLEHAQFQRQEARPEHLGVELEQALQHLVRLAWSLRLSRLGRVAGGLARARRIGTGGDGCFGSGFGHREGCMR